MKGIYKRVRFDYSDMPGLQNKNMISRGEAKGGTKVTVNLGSVCSSKIASDRFGLILKSVIKNGDSQ